MPQAPNTGYGYRKGKDATGYGPVSPMSETAGSTSIGSKSTGASIGEIGSITGFRTSGDAYCSVPTYAFASAGTSTFASGPGTGETCNGTATNGSITGYAGYAISP